MEELRDILEQTPLMIESAYNEEYELWEVSMDGQLIGSYITEDEAAELAANIHLAFEWGYVNGIHLALNTPGKAQKSLLERGYTSRS